MKSSTTTKDDFTICNQTRLAEIMGCDRTTIRRYQQLGMPHIPQTGKGREVTYKLPAALNWRFGYEMLKRQNLTLLSPLETALLGHSVGCAWGGESFAQWRSSKCTRSLVAIVGGTAKEFERAVGTLLAANLLPAEWRAT